MTGLKLAQRLEALEVRYAHQEAALEELTRSVLAQEQIIRVQGARLERLEAEVRALRNDADPVVSEERPPHY